VWKIQVPITVKKRGFVNGIEERFRQAMSSTCRPAAPVYSEARQADHLFIIGVVVNAAEGSK
jgi:hypothetical protein